MPNYGLQYQCLFDSIRQGIDATYRIEILGLNYSGAIRNLTGSTTPIVQSYATDDPKGQIKGSSVEMRFVNEGSTPLENFYSINDEQFKVRLWWQDVKIFNGTGNIEVTSFDPTLIFITTPTPINVDLGMVSDLVLNGSTYILLSTNQSGTLLTFKATTAAPFGTSAATPFSFTYRTDYLQFEGFLVQDDFTEIMEDFNHEIVLSANDNLGLLKDTLLDQFAPAQIIASGSASVASTSAHTIALINATNIAHVGDTLSISGGTLIDGTYTVNGVNSAAFPIVVYTIVESVISSAHTIGNYTITRLFNFDVKLSLLTILQCCLNATGLQLPVNIYGNIHEASQVPTASWLEQTLVNTETFLTNETTYDNCYNVLTNILQRFNATLFQAKGEWQIVRWDELRYYNKAVPNFRYDSNFQRIYTAIGSANGVVISLLSAGTSNTIQFPDQSYPIVPGDRIVVSGLPSGIGNGTYDILTFISVGGGSEVTTLQSGLPAITNQTGNILIEGNSVLSEQFNAGSATDIKPINGLTKKPYRPFQYDKETFNYTQPVNLLKNKNLQTLGPLIRTYTKTVVVNGVNTIQTINEYQMPYWTVQNFTDGSPNPALLFIRVTLDDVQAEISRYAVVTGGDGLDMQDYGSSPIEVNAGDKIKLDLSFFTSKSQPGSEQVIFVVKITNGTQTVYARNVDADTRGTWGANIGWLYQILDSNSNQAQSVSIEPFANIPFDGIMTVYIGQATSPAVTLDETLFNQISFTYIPFVNQSTKVIGQTHTDFQQQVIKNNEDITIYLDQATRNSINGTLFLNTLTGLIQTRCGQWKRTQADSPRNLGAITTTEQLFWRRIPRTILEGIFHGLVSNDNHLSMLSILKYAILLQLNFIFGKLDIDYRNNQVDCTLYEIYNDTEKDIDLVAAYDFEYLYATN